jgi:hypothetical protein
MSTRQKEFAKRQAQWAAFNRWQSLHEPAPISREDRLAWYVGAFHLACELLKPVSLNDIEAKVQFIRDVRERLAHLK